MARVPLIDSEDPTVDPEAAKALRQIEDAGFTVYNVQRAMANHPELMQAVYGLGSVAYLGDNLSAKQAELPYLTSAQTLECFY